MTNCCLTGLGTVHIKQTFEDLKVVIIGGGITGLSAALRLVNAGVKKIVVLEAQSEPGGRVKSVKLADGYVDLGAQWLHGSKSHLYRMARENHLLTERQSFEGLGNYYDNGKVIHPSLVMEVSDVLSTIMSELKELSEGETLSSVGEFMSSRFQIYLESCNEKSTEDVKMKLFDWHLRFQTIDNACTDLWKLSSHAFGDYKFVGGEDYINLKEGFQSLVRVLADKLPSGCLMTGCPVETVTWSESASSTAEAICRVTSENGDTFVCDHVLVTCSVGYLKDNWSMFYPSLPLAYQKGFNCIGFDPINKVFLEYKECWWDDLKGIQFVWDTEERKSQLDDSAELWTCDLTGFDPVVGLSNVLVGWVGGEGARLMEGHSPDVISQHSTKLLRNITGNLDIPLPVNCVCSSWSSNRFILGGYSHIRIERDTHKSYLSTLLKPIETSLPSNTKHPSIVFAGEALSGSHYSTTHGAFESGQRQADLLIDYFRSCS